MKIDVKFKGVEDVRKAINNLRKVSPQACGRAIKQAAMLVERGAKARAPVDTGRLRSSITHELTEAFGGDVNDAIIGTNVEYAPHQEFGTSRCKAHPYLIPALTEAVQRIIAFFKMELEKLK